MRQCGHGRSRLALEPARRAVARGLGILTVLDG